MSKLVERAIDAAGLGTVLASRRDAMSMAAHLPRLRAADLLALGALADRVRAEEIGAEVRIYECAPPSGDECAPPSGDECAPPSGDECAPPNGEGNGLGAIIVLPPDGDALTGLDLLREVAVARITGPRGAHVRVDWTRCGLELAQVALGFGADELVGFISTKRGLPIADGELAGGGKKTKRELAHVVKRKELALYVERGGRVAVFIRSDGAVETGPSIIEPTDEVDEVEPLKEAM